jgi:hypothetical protein
MPKGVINTQRMMCSNQQGYAQIWPFLEDRPPVLCEWLPWNHTFGFQQHVQHGAAQRRDIPHRRRQARARASSRRRRAT